jgi:hypothetical protein
MKSACVPFCLSHAFFFRCPTLSFFSRFTFADGDVLAAWMVCPYSGGGTVDFQEFVGGLSAFSSRGGRDEKLRCMSGRVLSRPGKTVPKNGPPLFSLKTFCISCLQGLRYGSRWIHHEWGAVSRAQNDGGQKSKGSVMRFALSFTR